MRTTIEWDDEPEFDVIYRPNPISAGKLAFEINGLNFQVPLHQAKALLRLLAGAIVLADAEWDKRDPGPK